MCTGSVPWPYNTAGTLSARRIRRAAPLPNSVRDSAWILDSAIGGNSSIDLQPCVLRSWGCWKGGLLEGRERGSAQTYPPDHRVDHGARLSPSPRQLNNPSEAGVQARIRRGATHRHQTTKHRKVV